MALKLNLNRIGGDMDSLRGPSSDVPAGRGMVVVKDFTEHVSRGSAVGHELCLEIVAWTDPAGVAQIHKEFIFVDDGKRDEDQCAARLMRAAIACGMLTPAQAEAAKKGQGEIDLDLTAAIGRPLFVEIVKRKDKKDVERTGVAEFGYAYFHVKDPRCADWPKHSMLLNQSLALVGEWEPLKKDAKDAAAMKSKPAASANPFAGKL